MVRSYIDVGLHVEFSTFVNITATFLCIFKCFREITTKDYQLRHAYLSALNNSVPTGRIFVQFRI